VADERDEIRNRIDIVELVGQRVSLKRKGRHFTGLCPFHDDRNPSFFVSQETGRYKCWACGATGDIFDWVMHDQNVEFGEALRILADRAGVTLKSFNPAQASAKKRQLDAMQAAQSFFVEQLAANTSAREYCEGRGLSEAVREKWGLGFAPGSDHALATHLRKLGFALADCRELFLVEDDGTGGFFDKFRGRLMFPIVDERGELVAFGGRIIGDGLPKYINSSDTPLFRKSRVLYGLYHAKEALAKSRTAILVEGYLDVIACHEAGLGNAVASLGTSLAEDHAKLLKRWCDEVIVLYDSDAAGEKAAQRACEILGGQGLKVRVALMPAGEDPDTLLRTAGPAAVQKAAKKGISPMEFRIMQIERKVDVADPEFWPEIVAALASSSNMSEIDREAARLAGKYMPGGREGAVLSLLQQVRAAQRQLLKGAKRAPTSTAAPVIGGALPRAEETVLRAFLESNYRKEAFKAMQGKLLSSPPGAAIADAILAAFDDAPADKPAVWLGQIEPAEVRDALMSIESQNDTHEMTDKKHGRPPVSERELSDVITELLTLRDERDLAALRMQADPDALQQAHERMKARFEREKHLWD
jgi:DNA primase